MLGTIISCALCVLSGFWFGFIFCASLKKKGYSIESKNINTVSITPSTNEQSDEVEFLPADIAVMYSDMSAASKLDELLKTIFNKIKEATQYGSYSVIISQKEYGLVDPESLIKALDDLRYDVSTIYDERYIGNIIHDMQCKYDIKISWKPKREESSNSDIQVNIIQPEPEPEIPEQETKPEIKIPYTPQEQDTSVFHLAFKMLRQSDN